MELKPCPFCGGEAKLLYGKPWQQKQNMRSAFVQCRICRAKTVTFFQNAYEAWQDTVKYAVEAWNRRVNNG
jgi:Lar family restriction alleviation protein